jgi:peroxiredoxin
MPVANEGKTMSTNDQMHYPTLERGQIIPPFTLPGTDSMPHSPWDYKQREHLILLFTQSAMESEGRGLLREFARTYRDFREEQCAILAITADPVIVNLQAQENLQLPFPLLADAQGNVIQRYTGWDGTQKVLTPALILADRYGELYEFWITKQESELPPITELLATLRYLNSLCTP